MHRKQGKSEGVNRKGGEKHIYGNRQYDSTTTLTAIILNFSDNVPVLSIKLM
jgi:hypothetical protein